MEIFVINKIFINGIINIDSKAIYYWYFITLVGIVKQC